MKKIKINKILPIVAVVAAIGAAIVPAHKSGAQTSETEYYWINVSGNYDGFQSKSDEEAFTGCDGSGAICARAYNANQFNTPGQPSSGLIVTPMSSDNVKQH